MITKDLIPAINIRDDVGIDFASLICSGQKTIETRNSNSLRHYINKRVRAIRTGIKPSLIVGEFTLGEPFMYLSEKEFKKDIGKHKVPEFSKFWIKDNIKFGYPIVNPILYKIPYEPVGKSSIIARKDQPYIEEYK